jgi:hypothetical protein
LSKNESHPLGQTVKFSAEFRVDSSLTDPTTAVLDVKRPVTGTTVQPTVTNDGTGLRSATYTVNEVGYWHYKWTSTGTAAGVQNGTFYVSEEAV